jgi:hypothetical protein
MDGKEIFRGGGETRRKSEIPTRGMRESRKKISSNETPWSSRKEPYGEHVKEIPVEGNLVEGIAPAELLKEALQHGMERLNKDDSIRVLNELTRGRELVFGGTPIAILAVEQASAAIPDWALGVILGGVVTPLLSAMTLDAWNDVKGRWEARQNPFERCERALRGFTGKAGLGKWTVEHLTFQNGRGSRLHLDRRLSPQQILETRGIDFDCLDGSLEFRWSSTHAGWVASAISGHSAPLKKWVGRSWQAVDTQS